ncbi:MAG: hypothetical protein WCQ21_09585 [Verrucomicrobiota bacterium]|jgi:hypothetical protein
MKHIILLALTLICFGSVPGRAQEKTDRPDLATATNGKSWKILNATAKVMELDGKRALHLKATGDSANRIAGLALPVGVEFGTGVIELDLKGKNIPQGSFLGVVFNVMDEKRFEGVYFRPFNFKAEEARRGRSVQYIAWPEYTWEKLRKDKPGQFEKPVNPVPDPDGWFHARIDVTEKQVRVFVNDATEPCLVVDRLARGDVKRPTGLFVDVAEGLYANLKITSAK